MIIGIPMLSAGRPVWTDGNISLADDPLYGLCVLTEQGWVGLDDLIREDIQFMISQVGDSCPWIEDLRGRAARRAYRTETYAHC